MILHLWFSFSCLFILSNHLEAFLCLRAWYICSHQFYELFEKPFKKGSFESMSLPDAWTFICVSKSVSTVSQVFELEGIESAD